MNSASILSSTNAIKENTKLKDPYVLLKKGVWLYFFLVLFEGGLRKWVLPQLATPLLIIRDPIAICLIFAAWQQNLFPNTIYLKVVLVIGVLSIFTAVFLGHGNLAVAIYGARILLFHFPLIFVVGRVFTRKDVVNAGKIILLLSFPMALLTAVQFYSPQSSFVNRGVGGDADGSGFSGALGYFRPSGIFSFTNGNSLFFGLAASFIFYFWLNTKEVNRVILISATLGLLAAIPLSISRTLFYSCCLAGVFAMLAAARKPKYLGKLIFAFIAGAIVMSFLGRASFFNTATEAFNDRFEGATEYEGGVQGSLINRYLGGMLTPFNHIQDRPIFGKGIGASTNIAVTMGIDNAYLIYEEDEWQRIIFELGLIMGLGIILCRLGIMFKIAASCYYRLQKGDVLPWMLLYFGAINIPLGQWEQPTSLGFSIVIGGLMIASLNKDDMLTISRK